MPFDPNSAQEEFSFNPETATEFDPESAMEEVEETKPEPSVSWSISMEEAPSENWLEELANYQPGYEYGTILPYAKNLATKEIDWWRGNELMKQAAQAILAPKRAYEGTFDVESPEAVQQAINLGGGLSLGPAMRNLLKKPLGSPTRGLNERVDPTIPPEILNAPELDLPAVFKSNRPAPVEEPMPAVFKSQRQEPKFPDVITNKFTPEEVQAARVLDAADRAEPINLTQFKSDKEVAAVVEMAMGKFTPAQIAQAKRGKITHEQAQAMADASGYDAEYFLKHGIGAVYNVEDTKKFQNIIDQATKEVGELSDKAISDDATPEDLVNFYKAQEVYSALLSKFFGATSESGRALNILQSSAESMKKQKYLQAVLDKIPPGDLLARAKVISQAKKDGNLKELLAKGKEWNWSDVFFEAWKANMLTGVKTHVKNLTSNTFTNVLSIPERVASATIGAVRTLRPGSNPERVRMQEVVGMLKGYNNIGRGLDNGWEALKKEDYLLEGGNKADIFEKAITGEKFRSTSMYRNLPAGAAQKAENMVDLTGQGIRATFRVLNATDVVFKTVAADQQLQALAIRKGLNSGIKDPKQLEEFVANAVANPSKEEMEAAMDWAHYITYTKELGTAGRAFQGLVHKYWPLHVMFPYTTTPINLTKRLIEMTPMQLLSPTTRKNIRAGGAEADMALGKLAVGSGILYYLHDLAKDKVISAPLSIDNQQAAAEYSAGYRPFAIQTDDGKYIPIDIVDPLGAHVVLASSIANFANFYENEVKDEAKLKQAGKLWAYTVDTMNNALVDKQYASGFANAISALSGTPGQLENWAQSMAKSTVPTIIRDVTSVTDTNKYDPEGIARYPLKEVFGDSIGDSTAAIGDSIQAGIYGAGQAIDSTIPWADKTNIPRALDMWGQPAQRPEASMWNPFKPVELTKDPLTLMRLKYNIKVPSPAAETRELGLDLNKAQARRWSELQGQVARKIMEGYYEPEDSILRVPAGDNKLLQLKQAEMLQKSNAEATRFANSIMGMMLMQNDMDKAVQELNKKLFPKPKRPDIVE